MRAVRQVGWLLVGAMGCAGPPADIARDAAVPAADAAPIQLLPDAAAAPADAAAAPADGHVIAALADAAPPPDPDNPYAITLVDVTDAVFDDVILGGSAADDHWAVGAGAAIGDLDGDGLPELILARVDDPLSTLNGGPSRLMRNDGGMHFTSVAAFEAMFAGVIAHAVALGDVDRDGDLDAFIGANGADFLLENDGAGNFTDVTDNAGVAGPDGDVTIGGLFADVNADGLLDLYVAQNTTTLPFVPNELTRNRLYLNLGDGAFLDVTDQSLADSDGSTQAILAFDLRGTGEIDLYVANDGLPGDAWYVPVGHGPQGVPVYFDQAVPYGVNTLRASMGVGLADVDRNLTPDLYISNWGNNALYLNRHPILPLANAAGVAGLNVGYDGAGVMQISWGVRFVDLDRDGSSEVYVATGGVTPLSHCIHYRQLDWYLRQPAPATPFVEITKNVGLPDTVTCGDTSRPVIGRGVVTGDLDADGDDDLIVTPFVERYRVYENRTPDANHALRVRLAGTVSAPDPIGATLRIVRLDGTQDVDFRFAGGDTYSQSDAALELGLGGAPGVMEAWVHWPSGLAQRIDGLPGFAIDAEVAVTEPLWLALSARIVEAADPAPILTYTAVAEDGTPLGPAGAGRTVSFARSDGVSAPVTDHGNGTYSAELPHPGVTRRTVVAIVVDGAPQRPRPMLSYR